MVVGTGQGRSGRAFPVVEEGRAWQRDLPAVGLLALPG